MVEIEREQIEEVVEVVRATVRVRPKTIAVILASVVAALAAMGITWEVATRRANARAVGDAMEARYNYDPLSTVHVRGTARVNGDNIVAKLENPNVVIDRSGIARKAEIEITGYSTNVGQGVLGAPAVIRVKDANGRILEYELDSFIYGPADPSDESTWESRATLRDSGT